MYHVKNIEIDSDKSILKISIILTSLSEFYKMLSNLKNRFEPDLGVFSSSLNFHFY